MSYVLVYGSLRRGEYNYSNQDLKYIRTLEISGYDLYKIGSYPGINVGNNKLKVDLMKFKSANSEKWIDNMEIGANYRIERVKVKNGEEIINAKIYVHNSDLSNLEKIDHGDWSKFLIES